MFSANCQICFSLYTVEKFRILTCGHGFCETCISRIPAVGRNHFHINCPLCRERIQKDHIARGIFLDFVEPKTAATLGVVEGMNRMDEDAPLASVKKAVEKLDRGVKSSRGNDDLTTQLIQSIEDFKTRIIPLFEKVRTQESDLESLRKDARKQQNEKYNLEKRLAKAESYQTENERLRGELLQAQRIADDTTLAAEEIKDKMVALQNELASYRRIAQELDGEKKRLAGQLERNANATRTAKEKYRVVKQQNADLQKKLEAAEKRQREESPSPIAETPQPQDYDGDYSAHEMGTPSRFMRPAQTQLMRVDDEFDWECMPRPGFGSAWQLNHDRGKENYGVLKKTRPIGIGGPPQNRRVTNPTSLMPLRLDRKGQPTTAVQLGPKRNLRI